MKSAFEAGSGSTTFNPADLFHVAKAATHYCRYCQGSAFGYHVGKETISSGRFIVDCMRWEADQMPVMSFCP